MVPYILIICAALIIVGFLLKWPKPGMYIYKGSCLLLLLPGLFFALFFTLMGFGTQALNIDLHPWREYVMLRFYLAAGLTVGLFVISQLPLIFIKRLTNNEKRKIVKIEGLLYLCLLFFGTGLCYYAVQEGDYPENHIVSQINDYYKAHGTYPDNISSVELREDSIFFSKKRIRYSHNQFAFTILVEDEYSQYVYDSRNELWDEIIDNNETDR